MAKGEKKLSAALVERQKKPGRVGDGGGLWLNITKTGTKSWIFRYTRPVGGVTEMGLGSYPAVTLAVARGIAAECRTLLAQKIDPKDDRSKEPNEIRTFGVVADLYIEAMKGKWTHSKTEQQWRRSLTELCAKIRDTPAGDIGTDDVLKVLTPIWTKTPETAMRTRSRIENVLDFAVVEGDRPDGLLNPARWRGHLDKRLVSRSKKTIQHHAAMAYQDVPAFMPKLLACKAVAAQALVVTILTAGRSGEILKAKWSEFRLDDALWIIPAERMKARQEHIVPLSPRAVEIIKSQPKRRGRKYVFSNPKQDRPINDTAMYRLMQRMKIKDAVPHGFRSSFRDWAGNETEFPREVAEACLAHTIGSQVERAYRRKRAVEKQRALLTAWADYCLGERSASNVVRLRSG